MNKLKTYSVRVSIPANYVVEARNEKEAKHTAKELYKKEFNTWINPEVHDVHESPTP